jgi:AcrR family transcriptional regulator
MTRREKPNAGTSVTSKRGKRRDHAPVAGRARISSRRSRAPKPRPSELPRKAPSQARARETVKAIMQAAAELIAARGYAAATTNKIAERAGVSIGSLYQYFPNKTAILVRLLEEHIEGVRPVVDRSIQELQDTEIPFDDAVRRLFRRLVEAHSDNPRLNRVLVEEVPRPKYIQELDRQEEALYTRRITAILQRRHDIHVEHPVAAAHVLVQATGALSRWLVHSAPEHLDREAYINEAVRLLSLYTKGCPRSSGRPRPA